MSLEESRRGYAVFIGPSNTGAGKSDRKQLGAMGYVECSQFQCDSYIAYMDFRRSQQDGHRIESSDITRDELVQQIGWMKIFLPVLLCIAVVPAMVTCILNVVFFMDVWGTNAVVPGALMFVGELCGAGTLFGFSSKAARDPESSIGRFTSYFTKQPLGLVRVFPLVGLGTFVMSIAPSDATAEVLENHAGDWYWRNWESSVFVVHIFGAILLHICGAACQGFSAECLSALMPDDLFGKTAGNCLAIRMVFGVVLALALSILYVMDEGRENPMMFRKLHFLPPHEA